MKKLRLISLIVTIVTAFMLPAFAQTALISKPVNTVISNYLEVKNALANNDGDAASAKAKTLLASLNELPLKSLNASQNALVTKLAYDSRHISEVNRVAHQREHFASLSDNLYTLIKGLKLNQQVLYRQYCSMTKKYFLSESDKGKDPYMGMSNCSKVTEIITAIKQ